MINYHRPIITGGVLEKIFSLKQREEKKNGTKQTESQSMIDYRIELMDLSINLKFRWNDVFDI